MKTEQLTAKEIDRMASAPRFSLMQFAVMDAQSRTKKRLGVSVEQGAYHVSAVAYAVKNEKVSGAADMRRLASFGSQSEVVEFLNSIDFSSFEPA